jgi:outer membrane murein-binding lipoprotein Lpp
MNKEKPSEIKYALSDYKQLVLQYKTKYSELVRACAFWRTSTVWLFILAAAMLAVGIYVITDSRRQFMSAQKDAGVYAARIQSLSEELERCRKDQEAAKQELDQKRALIGQLEKNLSTVSKQQVERLLKEKGPR